MIRRVIDRVLSAIKREVTGYRDAYRWYRVERDRHERRRRLTIAAAEERCLDAMRRCDDSTDRARATVAGASKMLVFRRRCAGSRLPIPK